MKKNYLLLIMTLLSADIFAQTVTIKFTGQDEDNHYVRLDSVVVHNLIREWHETLYWPDTVLVMQVSTGIDDFFETNPVSTIQLSQNTPNPFNGITFTNLTLAEQGKVLVEVTDMSGRVMWSNTFPSLQQGVHQLRVSLSTPGVYFLTARMNGNVSSVKIINQSEGGLDRIEYQGTVENPYSQSLQESAPKGSTENPFFTGDQMEYIGFTSVNGVRFESTHITQTQNESQTIPLSFNLTSFNNDGQPCPYTPTVTDYDGNVYNTVRIGQQCWMKENLRTDHYADGTAIPDSCPTLVDYHRGYRYNYATSGIPLEQRGYLYNWRAVMHNANSSWDNPSGVQGVCPVGWHVPSYVEWEDLMNYVGSQNQYVCDNNSTYIAKALASTTWWHSDTTTCAVGNDAANNNATGFSAVPTGRYFYINDGCVFSGISTSFWSATEVGDENPNADETQAYDCKFTYGYPRVYLDLYQHKIIGNPVRCLRDATCAAQQPTISTIGATSVTATSAVLGGDITYDGGNVVTSRGICWSTTHNPTISDNHTSDGTGMGIFTSSPTGLTSSTTYYARAYATNAYGTSYGREVSFFTAPVPFVCGTHTIGDYDGNVYNTVQIGQQCWMKENLRTEHYADGTVIMDGSTNDSYYVRFRYNYTSSSIPWEQRGYLYNWPAVLNGAFSSNANPSGVQGICPTGWHVPSDAEWEELKNYVGSQSQYVCGNYNTYIAKALAATTWWDSNTYTCTPGNNQSSNNATGFSAIPAGCRHGGSSPLFGDSGYKANFWSASLAGNSGDSYKYIMFISTTKWLSEYDESSNTGYSVRCLRD